MTDTKIGPGEWAGQVVAVMPYGGGQANLTSNANGVMYSNLPNVVCRQVTFANNSNTTVEVQQEGSSGFPIFVQNYFTFYGLRNTSQLAIRRADQSNTQVTIDYRYEG
jgi:hypothetical protein